MRAEVPVPSKLDRAEITSAFVEQLARERAEAGDSALSLEEVQFAKEYLWSLVTKEDLEHSKRQLYFDFMAAISQRAWEFAEMVITQKEGDWPFDDIDECEGSDCSSNGGDEPCEGDDCPCEGDDCPCEGSECSGEDTCPDFDCFDKCDGSGYPNCKNYDFDTLLLEYVRDDYLRFILIGNYEPYDLEPYCRDLFDLDYFNDEGVFESGHHDDLAEAYFGDEKCEI
jgi:hypothetical protein